MFTRNMVMRSMSLTGRMADFLPTGEQWCPHCHVQCEERDGGEWFECPECGYNITAEDAELFGSYPTEASTYD